MPRNDKLYDIMKQVTEGTYVGENEGPTFEMRQAAVQNLFSSIENFYLQMRKSDTNFIPGDVEGIVMDAIEEAVIRFNDEYSGTDPNNPVNIDAPVEEADMGAPTQDTLESVLSEKDDKKKDEEWSDDRSHDDAVKQIVRDAWKEILVDGKFKTEATPTRDEVMKEVEFQSKHGLEHRPDASAVRYDAYKKLMKKVKNIEKKLDAESSETPEEEDVEAKTSFEQQPKEFLGLKT